MTALSPSWKCMNHSEVRTLIIETIAGKCTAANPTNTTSNYFQICWKVSVNSSQRELSSSLAVCREQKNFSLINKCKCCHSLHNELNTIGTIWTKRCVIFSWLLKGRSWHQNCSELHAVLFWLNEPNCETPCICMLWSFLLHEYGGATSRLYQSLPSLTSTQLNSN